MSLLQLEEKTGQTLTVPVGIFVKPPGSTESLRISQQAHVHCFILVPFFLAISCHSKIR